MSDTTVAASANRAPHRPATAQRRARAVLATEWIKLRSLPSMLIAPLLTAVFCIGLPALVCWRHAAAWPTADAATRVAFDPVDANFDFVQIGILFFGVIGALMVTNEYGHGLIRTTFAATPQRVLVLAAKAVLVGLLTFVVSAVICIAAFYTGQGILASGHAPHVSLGDPGVLGRVMGTVYYMTAVGLIGLFVGVIARSAAGAISGVFALLLVLPIMVNKIPKGGVQHAVPYLPSNLGDALWSSHLNSQVSGNAAALWLAVWVVVLGAVAVFALRGRDA